MEIRAGTPVRIERDSLGEVPVPQDALWGAQTQRSLENFRAGPPMPMQVIYGLAIIKRASAIANVDCGVLPQGKADLIVTACDEILQGKLDGQFPLRVYQTGSGTQTNMNVNEVIANRAHILSGGKLTDKTKVLHPNDDVNKSQSSNDVFPAAMHIAAYMAISDGVIPAVVDLRETLARKSVEFQDIIKAGRTHTMDAVPLTVGQEFSGWVAQLDRASSTMTESLDDLLELPVGGTAVGTGLNAPDGFDERVALHISAYTNIPFRVAQNKFHEIAAHGALVKASAGLKIAAVDLATISNNIRLLASGPRTGIGELTLPENEPGSSIMPGKVNPTQAEALRQACARVIANDLAVSLGGMMGEFQLNVAKPLIIASLLESTDILTITCNAFNELCAKGIEVNRDVVQQHLERTLMLITALVPHIGYERAAEIALTANREGRTLKDVAVQSGIDDEDFTTWTNPANMIGPA